MNDHDALFFVCHILGMSARLWSCAEETAGQAASENDAHIGTGWQRMISDLIFSYPTVCHMPFLYHAFSYSVILSCDNLVTISEINRNEMNISDIFRVGLIALLDAVHSLRASCWRDWLSAGEINGQLAAAGHLRFTLAPLLAFLLLGSKVSNVGKTNINHPPNHHFYRWYKLFPNGSKSPPSVLPMVAPPVSRPTLDASPRPGHSMQSRKTRCKLGNTLHISKNRNIKCHKVDLPILPDLF